MLIKCFSMKATKMIWRLFLSFVLILTMLPIGSLQVYANSEIPVYSITLQPGDGTGTSIVISSRDDGRYYGESNNGAGVGNGQFFAMNGEIWFKCPDCPDSFTAPDGKIFVGWNDGISPGYMYKATDGVTLTAQWAEAGNAKLLSLTPSSGTLAPQFDPDQSLYSINVSYNGYPVSVTLHGVPQDSGAMVGYQYDSGNDQNLYDTCSPMTDENTGIYIRVTNGANEEIYYVVLNITYTLTLTTEGNGTAKAYADDEEDYTGRNESRLILKATPADGWEFKEWRLVSGNGSLTYQNSQSSGVYRFNKSNAEVAAVFEELPTCAVMVTVAKGTGMTKTSASGAESQSGLMGAMTDVVYTADEGYYFPTDYSVSSVNGISVTRNSDTQITVSGTPTADTTITLPAATAKTKPTAPTEPNAVPSTNPTNNAIPVTNTIPVTPVIPLTPINNTDSQPVPSIMPDNQKSDNQKPDVTVDNADIGKTFIVGQPGKAGWDVIKENIQDVIKEKLSDPSAAGKIVIDMNGYSIVPGDIISEINGQDVTVVLDLGNGIKWSINGLDITVNDIDDIDFAVKVGENIIPVDALNNVTGERYSMQISLSHEGDFGFAAALSVDMDKKNAGLYANLFYFNPVTGELEFVYADEIDENGIADLKFTHASDYTIAIDKEPMNNPVTVEQENVVQENNETQDVVLSSDNSILDDTSNDANSKNGIQWWITLLICFGAAGGLAGVWIVKKKK